MTPDIEKILAAIEALPDDARAEIVWARPAEFDGGYDTNTSDLKTLATAYRTAYNNEVCADMPHLRTDITHELTPEQILAACIVRAASGDYNAGGFVLEYQHSAIERINFEALQPAFDEYLRQRAVPVRTVRCPQCRSGEHDAGVGPRFLTAENVPMRACFRCLIQWRDDTDRTKL